MILENILMFKSKTDFLVFTICVTGIYESNPKFKEILTYFRV